MYKEYKIQKYILDTKWSNNIKSVLFYDEKLIEQGDQKKLSIQVIGKDKIHTAKIWQSNRR